MLALQQEPDTLHPGIGSMMARTIVLSPIIVGCMGQNEKAEWIPLGCETVPTHRQRRRQVGRRGR